MCTYRSRQKRSLHAFHISEKWMCCFGLCVQLRWITWLRMWACPRREGWSSESTRLCSDCYRWRRDRRIDGSRTEHPPMCFTSIPPFFLQRPHTWTIWLGVNETKRNDKNTGSPRLSTYSSVNTKAIPHLKKRHYCAASPYSSRSFLSFTTKRPFQGFRKKPREKWASIVWSQITKAPPVGIQC